MISLAEIEAVHVGSCELYDPSGIVMNVVTHSEHFRWKTLPDGTEEPWRIITKPIAGLPIGRVISLRELHEVLKGCA